MHRHMPAGSMSLSGPRPAATTMLYWHRHLVGEHPVQHRGPDARHVPLTEGQRPAQAEVVGSHDREKPTVAGVFLLRRIFEAHAGPLAGVQGNIGLVPGLVRDVARQVIQQVQVEALGVTRRVGFLGFRVHGFVEESTQGFEVKGCLVMGSTALF